jgi:hypothetical protein
MIEELKNELIKNPIHIENILNKYEFYHIDVRSKEIRFARAEDGNPSSIRIKLLNNEKLYVDDFAKSNKCDLIKFIIQSRNVEFKDVINSIKSELGISYFTYIKRTSIFGGFYDKIKAIKSTDVKLKTYDENILLPYLNKFNIRFLNDNISLESQKKFKIGFDVITQRITCPWWSFEGELVGITGRYNGDYEQDEVFKWLPVIPHPKSQTLYGYTENYQYLQGADEIYVGESEKFCLQLDTMGIYTSVALGGNTIHVSQIKHLINLCAKKIIFCYDEGLELETILAQIYKVKSMLKFYEIQVGYINDKNSDILPKESKASPSDLGKENFLKLINNYVEWV